MAKPFQLINLARRGWCQPHLNHCLIDLLFIISYCHILALPEYKLKVVNVCEMHGKGGKLWCCVLLTDFNDMYMY